MGNRPKKKESNVYSEKKKIQFSFESSSENLFIYKRVGPYQMQESMTQMPIMNSVFCQN